MDWIMPYYQWIKVVHIISVICWMAGLFYLPRLFVYHAQNRQNLDFVKIIKIQEHKLFAYIASPAMLFSVASGLALLWLYADIFKSGLWIHIKLLSAILLLIFHIVCGIFVTRFRHNLCTLSERFFRVFNEIPTILMIIIVICAVIKF